MRTAALVAAVGLASAGAASAETLTKPASQTRQVRALAVGTAGLPPGQIARLVTAGVRRQVAKRGDGRPPKVSWRWVVAPTAGRATADFRVTARGFADDSVIGRRWDVRLALRRGQGAYSPATWQIASATVRQICARGVNSRRTRCV